MKKTKIALDTFMFSFVHLGEMRDKTNNKKKES